jgi:hypothetical protein
MAATGLAVSLTACVGATDIPPGEKEAINLGTNAEVGSVSVDNLLLVTRGEARSARLIGVLTNRSGAPVEVELSDQDDTVTVTLDGGQQYAFQEHPTFFATADDIPGALATVTIGADEDVQSVTIPIRDGSLDWLEPYLPENSG